MARIKKVAIRKNKDMLTSPSDFKEVSVKKANNGYIVSSFTSDKPKTFIAKNKTDAKKIASKLLKI